MLGPIATGVALGGVEVGRSTTSGGGDRTERAGPDEVLVTGVSTIAVGAAVSIGLPSERAAMSTITAHMVSGRDVLAQVRHTDRLDHDPRVDARRTEAHREEARPERTRKVGGENVRGDVAKDVRGRSDPQVERALQRVDVERLDVHDTTTLVTPARAAAAAMQAQRTSCGRCLASSSGVTVSRTFSGVMAPAASEAARTLLSRSGGRWFARTSGVA